MRKESKIYVAGHLGLVGSALWKNLQSKGYTNLVGKSLSDLNLMDPKATEEFFEKERPEYVFLAAAKVGGIVANNKYRAEFIYNNLMIQNNVINSAYKYGAQKLLFLGSTCIYPKEAPQPMKEDYLLTSPLEYTNEPYAIAKIAGIKMCESYNIQYGTNFISVMPTNLYGPNDNFDLEKSHVLPALIRKFHLGKALENNDWKAVKADLDKRPVKGINGSSSNETIEETLAGFGVIKKSDSVKVEIWGTGKPKREFLWSEEMADACVFIMENVDFKDVNPCTGNSDKTCETRNTHINIGTGKEVSIHELAATIKAATGFKGEFIFDASKPDGTMRKLTDVSKLHKLGWKHQVELDEGIKRLYKWYLEN